MWKEKITHVTEEKKRVREEKENTHRKGKKNGRLIFLLSVGDKLKNLNLYSIQ